MDQQLGIVLEPAAQGAEIAVMTVPHSDHIVAAEENHHLAGLDDLTGRCEFVMLDVPHGLENGEEHVVVAFELGPLVRLDRVLDGERVQVEPFCDAGELNLVRLVQADPDESPVGLYVGHGFVVAASASYPAAVAVDGTVDDSVVANVEGGIHAHRRATYRSAQVTDHGHGDAPYVLRRGHPGALGGQRT